MAFVHHQPRQQRRDRQDYSEDQQRYTTASSIRQERDAAQDWSIVFPGRVREPVQPQESEQASQDSSQRSTASSSGEHTGDDLESEADDHLVLTLPPLHDGTGRFSTYLQDPASAGLASTQSGEAEEVLSDTPRSEVFPESVFSGSESQLDADEELGFGSGSDFDFGSDIMPASISNRSSSHQRVRRTSRRRSSKLSQMSPSSEDEQQVNRSRDTLDSKAWSFIGRSRAALDRVPESPSASTQLYSSARSSRLSATPKRPTQQETLPLVFTSDSEQEQEQTDQLLHSHVKAAREQLYDADLASSNLAQSAGLAHVDLEGSLRRPKRRHRRSAAGRSSKRSNTSQSHLSVDPQGRPLYAALSERNHRLAHHDGSSTPQASDSLANIERSSKTTRMIGSILRRVFDLEPDVLEAFMSEDQRYRSSGSQSHQRAQSTPGFAFEHADGPVASVPMGSVEMMLDGRDEQEMTDSAPLPTFFEDEAEEEEDATDAKYVNHILSSSPLFDNTKPVAGEEVTDDSAIKLTEAALLQRRASPSTRIRSHSLMEPTTREAFSSFMNTVMPVPMPFRLLGALFGWSSIWSHNSKTKEAKEREEEEIARREAEEERRYRYERLLSAQQAKAWSRRYRGILFANVDDEEQSLDVPELWRGEEHPAIAGEYH